MISQIFAVTAVNLRSIRQRLGSSAVAIFGIVGVVIVFVAVLSIAEGFRAAMQATGDPDTVMIMRAGADTEMTSGLTGDNVRVIGDTPGIARDAAGPLVSPELLVIVNHPLRRSGLDANVPLRGVTLAAFKVHDKVRIVAGRNFEPGRNEIIVGRAAVKQFTGLDLGSSVKWGQNAWQVVGIFSDNQSVSEGEIWCDARVLQPAYRRGNTYQSVYARLASHDGFDALKDALTTNPQLNVSAMREPDYYAQQSQQLQRVIRGVGFVIAALMGIGAVFGAVNTMYTAVATRTREIATLRALGFGSFPVVFSVLFEAVVLSLIGGVIGGVIAWAAFNGYQTSTMNFQSFSQVSFAFAVTPALLVQGLTYAILMGLVGGMLPAVRAARLPVVTALREL
ncbi:MAG TPA: ABC transporter permease [Vicinamibacterales bacterium]|nr:ABC transporter permease [Vicinamibacterales bacterium]